MWDVPVLDLIKQRDPFLLLKKGIRGPTFDLSISQQIVATSEAAGLPSTPKQRAQRGKAREARPVKTVTVVPAKSKGNGKASIYSKSKRKMVDSSAEGALKKKLSASGMQAAEKVKV